MGEAKKITLRPISGKDADRIVKALHYSGKTASNSRIHLGAFFEGKCSGAMQFGPPQDYSKAATAFPSLGKRQLVELNRMAFGESLPRNGESRCIAVACRMLRERGVEMVQSYSDACQSGDGAIYRACGFLLVSIKRNASMWRGPDGYVYHDSLFKLARPTKIQRLVRKSLDLPVVGVPALLRAWGAEKLAGYQLRYLLPLTDAARSAIILPSIPYDDPRLKAVRMYRGKRLTSIDSDAPTVQVGEGGANPTVGLHSGGDT